jgi:hypothetical protein
MIGDSPDAFLQDQRDFNRRLVTMLEKLEIEYAIGGSMAAMIYSETRSTKDIDMMLRVDMPSLELVVNEVESWQIYIDPLDTIIEFNLPSRLPINVVDGMSGVKADLYVAAPTGLDQSAMSRKRRMSLYSNPYIEAWFLAPENVILYKLDYFKQSEGASQKHPIDITKMLAVTGDQLDLPYLEHWAKATGVWELWQALWDEFHR